MKESRFVRALKKRVLITDGAMGTMLQERGLKTGQAPEELNLTAPVQVGSIHTDYFKAGSDIVLTNTFGATRKKLDEYGLGSRLDAINRSAVTIAREAAAATNGFVAGDIGPLGSYLTPLGPVGWDEAYELFAEQVKALAAASPDLIIIETMSDIREAKVALRAAKDFFSGPVFVQMTFTEDGTTVTGTDILSFLTCAEALDADGIGINCSVGPKNIFPLIQTLVKNTHLPVSVKPNRGMPQLIDRQTIYPGTIDEFVHYAKKCVSAGAQLIGGCCGTDPSFIAAVSAAVKGKKPKIRTRKQGITRFCSRTRTLSITHSSPLVKIGERINPTGRKILQKTLNNNDFTMVRNDAQAQVKAGADMLDVNMGLPGGDEIKLMEKALDVVQSITTIPLCIDSNAPAVLEAALKRTEGKPLVNSVSGEKDKLDTILPLVKRYGAGVIGLTIDEKGIPKTAAGRLAIAKRILRRALQTGIPKEDIIIDNLSLAVSAQSDQPKETLKAIRMVSSTLKLKTILGISNVSFGLPNRPVLNSTFLKLARKSGLSCAIVNPLVPWGANDPYALKVLSGKDKNCTRYLRKYGGMPAAPSIKQQKKTRVSDILSTREELRQAILNGIQESIYPLIDKALSEHIEPREISAGILMPTLEEVGEKFVRKQYFLPQVLMCADTIQKGILYLQSNTSLQQSESRGTMLIATVKGDIHDIGKNIVRSVFENYGWQVRDLGKNVPAREIIDQAKEHSPDIIGLSALMTTTMVHMEDVIRLSRQENITAKIIIGGAAVTRQFADSIQADGYAPDAIQAVRLAERLITSE